MSHSHPSAPRRGPRLAVPALALVVAAVAFGAATSGALAASPSASTDASASASESASGSASPSESASPSGRVLGASASASATLPPTDTEVAPAAPTTNAPGEIVLLLVATAGGAVAMTRRMRQSGR